MTIRSKAAPPQADGVQQAHPEHYAWGGVQWDIARLRTGIERGLVSAEATGLERGFIEAYARQVIGLHDGIALARRGEHLSRFSRLELDRLWALPEQALAVPLLILSVAPGAGLFALPGSVPASQLLGDGHHRLARAFLCGHERLSALVISADDTAAHRCVPGDTTASRLPARPAARRGAPLTTGRFATRAELEDKVRFLHRASSLSDEAIGRNCQVSQAVVRRILSTPAAATRDGAPDEKPAVNPVEKRHSPAAPPGEPERSGCERPRG